MADEWQRFETSDGQEYFYNPKRKTSVWEVPDNDENVISMTQRTENKQGNGVDVVNIEGWNSNVLEKDKGLLMSGRERWEEHIDESTGRTYYHNTKTNETRWNNPQAPDDWIGDEWTGVLQALEQAEVEQLGEKEEAVRLAGEIEQMRRTSTTQECEAEEEKASQFITSMKMLKTQMVFQKYKDQKKQRIFQNRQASQFKDSFNRIKSLLNDNDENDQQNVSNKRTTSHMGQLNEDRSPVSDADADEINLSDMFTSTDFPVESDGHNNELSLFTSPAQENIVENTLESDDPKHDLQELCSYAHDRWDPVVFQCVVFVNYENSRKRLQEFPLWMDNSVLQIGTVLVAWEGLIFHRYSSSYQVKVPYDKIISWTIETSLSSDENFVDITMDGTFNPKTGDIKWFTQKLLELRCCVESQDVARDLSNSIKGVCLKIREEAMATVDVQSLRQSKIGKAFMNGVDRNDNLMNAKQRRASLMKIK